MPDLLNQDCSTVEAKTLTAVWFFISHFSCSSLSSSFSVSFFRLLFLQLHFDFLSLFGFFSLVYIGLYDLFFLNFYSLETSTSHSYRGNRPSFPNAELFSPPPTEHARMSGAPIFYRGTPCSYRLTTQYHCPSPQGRQLSW